MQEFNKYRLIWITRNHIPTNKWVHQIEHPILKVEALMYQRNQAYAFIAIQGLARDFLTFIEEKQCVQTTDAELRMLLKIYTPKKKNTKK